MAAGIFPCDSQALLETYSAMTYRSPKPILVTGAHRSGSTWVGRMIARSPKVGYIREPFNKHHRPGICAARFDYWFPYICDKNAALYRKDIDACINFRYRLLKELPAIERFKDIARISRDLPCFFMNRILGKRPLLKDPIAIFSAPWLADTFYMDVVIIIRHPAAFAGSLKKANWKHPFDHFLNQPLLMEHHLSNFTTAIKSVHALNNDIIDQAILLWNIIHHMILKYKNKYPGWTFVRHEDISKDPLAGFSRIFKTVGLPFSPAIQKKILDFSRPDGYPRMNYLGHIIRDSESNIKNWVERLDKKEINRVRSGTEEIATAFYNDSDWS
jgi:hypothetical protein